MDGQTFFLLLVAAVLISIVAIVVPLGRRRAGEADYPGAQVPLGLRTARVFRVIDGDTVIVSTNWRKITVRLDAIDCPEIDQEWGDTARFGLVKLIGGRNVRMEEYGPDEYGRTLATLYVRKHGRSDWINVNSQMVMLGHAWVGRYRYSNQPIERQKELNRLERWARSRSVGLWQTDEPTPPWQWRSGRGTNRRFSAPRAVLRSPGPVPRSHMREPLARNATNTFKPPIG